MNQIILLSRVIATLILITMGVDNLSAPSNWKVVLGVVEILVGIAIIYKPFISLFKKV